MNPHVCKCNKRNSNCPSVDCKMNSVGDRFGIYDGRSWTEFTGVFDFEKSDEAQTLIDFFLNYRCMYDSVGIFFQLDFLMT